MKIHLLLMANTKHLGFNKKIIVKYQFLSSILIIKNKMKNTNTFRSEQLIL